MIEDGKLLRPYIATAWEDTGTPECTLHAHRFVLDRSGGQARPREGVTFIPPVYVADDAEVSESVIGPYVTVESGCRVERSVLSDCILAEDVAVTNQMLERALLGQRTCAGRDAALGEPGRRLDARAAGPGRAPDALAPGCRGGSPGSAAGCSVPTGG